MYRKLKCIGRYGYGRGYTDLPIEVPRIISPIGLVPPCIPSCRVFEECIRQTKQNLEGRDFYVVFNQERVNGVTDHLEGALRYVDEPTITTTANKTKTLPSWDDVFRKPRQPTRVSFNQKIARKGQM